MTWETVIGLEIHAQLATGSKIFSSAPTAYGAAPNTQANLVDLGYPGALPVLNREAVRMAVKFGLAVGATVARRSVFARKNYFYPDLPKGYQISQYERPIVETGRLEIVLEDGARKTVGITRAHLEEDAGKSLHEDFQGQSGIDLNRAGTPLLEIVSEPDMRSAKEAVAYMKKIHTLVRYLEICDGNMQEGSFRCDANVSVRRSGETRLGTRCEIKNLNSFRFMEQAIEFEAKRQIEILENGGKIVQETRLYDPDRDETRSMRTKEDAQDYRYFPDPDLLPLVITEKMIEDVSRSMPELPGAKRAKYQQLGVSTQTVEALLSNVDMVKFFESMSQEIRLYEAISKDQASQVIANAANTTVSSLSSKISDWGNVVTAWPDLSKQMARIELYVAQGKISSVAAKEVRDAVLAREGSVDEVISKRGLEQMSDSVALEKLVDEVLAASPKQVEDYRSGKEKAFNSLVGQVMKATRGKANPAQLNEILRRKLAR